MVKSSLERLNKFIETRPTHDSQVAKRNDALGNSRRTVIGNLIEQLETAEKAETTFEGIENRIKELGEKGLKRTPEESEELNALFDVRDVWKKQRVEGSLGDPDDFSSMNRFSI